MGIKIWGFDLGTNSIGWSVIDDFSGPDDIGAARKVKILDMGVVRFHDSRVSEKEGLLGDSLAKSRTMARGVRKNRDRKLRRVRNLAKLIKAELGVAEAGINNMINPYEARARAASEKLADKAVLARALLHLGLRRGFKSNSKSGKKEAGKFKARIEKLSQHLQQNNQTLGQFLYERQKAGQPLRFRPADIWKEFGIEQEFYPTRAIYQDEFEQIKQHNESWFSEDSWARLRHLILEQRPLKSQKDLRKNCPIYKELKCATIHSLAFQWNRMKQELDNMRFLGGEKTRTLTHEEKLGFLGHNAALKKDVSFSALVKFFKLDGMECNLETKSRKGIKGLTTLKALRDILGGDLGGISPDQLDQLLSDAIDTEDDEAFMKIAQTYYLGLPQDKLQQIKDFADDLSDTGSAAFSLKALEALNLSMRDKGLDYPEAMLDIGYHHSDHFNDGEVIMPLPYYGELLKGHLLKAKSGTEDEREFGKIPNASVHVALNQLRHLVNRLHGRFGFPDKIKVEFGRQLKLSPEKLRKVQKDIDDNTKLNKSIKEGEKGAQYRLVLAGAGKSQMKGKDLLRYKLWEELSGDGMAHNCPYCGEPISVESLAGGGVEIEHILPESWSHDNSKANLTIVHKGCNAQKGDMTPYEFRGDLVVIRIQKTNMPKSKKWRFYEDAREVFEKKIKRQLTPSEIEKYGGDINGAWRARQRTDNAWIARVGRQYLAAVTGKISAIEPYKADYISKMRGIWRMNELLQNSNAEGANFKNRQDVRHHAIDALVVACASLGAHQKASRLSGQGKEIDVPEMPAGLKEQARQMLDKMLIAEKPRHKIAGCFYKETAYGLLDIEKHKQEYKAGFRGVARMTVQTYFKEQKKKIEEIEQAEKKIEELEALKEKTEGLEGLKNRAKELEELEKKIEKAKKSKMNKEVREDKYIRDRRLKKKIENIIRQEWAAAKARKQESKDKGEADNAPSLEAIVCKRVLEETGAKRLRYLIKNDTLNRIESADYKAYETDSIACVMIWKVPDRKKGHIYKPIYIPYHKGPYLKAEGKPLMHCQPKESPLHEFAKPHPAAKHVMTLYKGDMVALKYESKDFKELEKKGNMILTPIQSGDERQIVCRVARFVSVDGRVGVVYQYAQQAEPWLVAVGGLLSKYQMRKFNVAIDGSHTIQPFQG